jgi:hypothetical protein
MSNAILIKYNAKNSLEIKGKSSVVTTLKYKVSGGM